MDTRRPTQIAASIISAIVLNIGLASVGICQTTTVEEMTPEAEKTPDEIIVYGETNVINLRNALNLAQDSFFEMYNKLNSDDEFDVECKHRQKSIEERQRTHRCMPVFALKYAAQSSSGFLRDMGRGGSNSDFANLEYEARVKAKEKEMWAEVVELARSNPQFREEIKRLMAANRAMAEERERRGPCPKIFCRD